MSRPKYSAQQVADAIRAAGGVVAVAARALGCDRNTVYAYAERHATVRTAMEEANETNLDVAEAGLASFVRGTVAGRAVDDRVRMDAIKFYLRTKGRDRGYGDRLVLDFDPARMTDAQLAAIAAGKDPEGL